MKREIALNHPQYGLANEALHYACQQLATQVRNAHAKRTANSGPMGDQILEAVLTLPYDWDKFEQLPFDTQQKLMEFIEKTEISYLAEDTIKLIEETFPLTAK